METQLTSDEDTKFRTLNELIEEAEERIGGVVTWTH